MIWNRQRKRDRWGVKRYLDRREGEWLRREAPELRTVPEALWQATQRRLDRACELYAGSGVRASLDRGASSRTWRPQRAEYPLERLDAVVLEAIAEALDERNLERAVDKALERLRRAPDKARAAGTPSGPSCCSWRPACGRSTRSPAVRTDPLRAELAGLDQRKKALAAELEALTGRRDDTASRDVERLRREIRRHVAEVRVLLAADVAQGPTDSPAAAGRPAGVRGVRRGRRCRRRRGYRFTGQSSYAELLPGDLLRARAPWNAVMPPLVGPRSSWASETVKI